MIPVHAMSALDTAEDRMLTSHLAECDECRRELDEWKQTTSSLALAAEPVEPSVKVGQQLLNQIRIEKSDSKTTVVPFPQARKSIWSSFGTLGAIAAMVLFAISIVYIVVLYRENKATQDALVKLKNDMATAQKEIADQRNLIEMFSKPGTRLAELKGTADAPNAMAKVVFDRSGQAMVMASGLPAPPSGKAYQLWFIVNGKPPMPGKTFSTDTHGKAMMKDQIPAGAIHSGTFAVTLEPKDGVPAPTGQMYLSGGI